MTQRYFPFDAGAGSSVTEEQWRAMASTWLATGVLRGELLELEVFADDTGRQVKVRTGRAWVRGHFFESDATETLPISANASGNPRIDRVVARVDFVANTIALVVKTGVAATVPVPPALQDDTTAFDLPLAQVAVANGATSIEAGDVSDERGILIRIPGSALPELTRDVVVGDSGGSSIPIATTPNSMIYRMRADLSAYDECRVHYGTNSTVPAASLGVQFSLDGGTTWKSLLTGVTDEVGPSAADDTPGIRSSAWGTLHQTARTDVLLRLAFSGTGSVVLQGRLTLELRSASQ